MVGVFIVRSRAQPQQLSVDPVAEFKRARMLRTPKPIELRYQFRLNAKRRQFRDSIQALLRAVTDDPNANMDWLRVVTGTQKIVFKYHVELVGWLDGVTFEAPGHISSLDTLYALITALARGEMMFVRLSPEEVVRRGEEVDVYYATTELSLSARADTGKVRPLRPLETRSARLRKGTVNKTSEWVPAEELAAEAAEEAAAAAAALVEDEDEIEEAVWSDDE